MYALIETISECQIWVSMICFFISGACFGFAFTSIMYARKDKRKAEKAEEKE